MKKKGISLIVLVITIIVIIVLAGAVILSLASSNPISQANKATYLSDLKNFETELNLYETKQFADKLGMYDPTKLQADETSVTYDNVVIDGKTMNDIITSLGKAKKYAGQFVVVDGKLIYQGSDTNRQSWSTDAGVQVVVLGEPKVNIIQPSQTVVKQGTNIVYTIKFTSNAALTTVDLSSKVEVLDNNNVALAIQPTITLGTVSGTNLDSTRQVDVTVATNTLANGSYKLKIKSGSVTNIDGKFNSQDTISLIGFDIDNTSPTNPLMSANPPNNGNVAVTITYSSDTVTKEYSLDATNWNTYTTPVLVTDNGITVYARGKDRAGNESGVSTLTVNNIDKLEPTVVYGTNGATNVKTANTVVTVSDENGVNASTLQYVWDTQNVTTPSSGWTAFTNGQTLTKTNVTGTYYLWIKASDNAGNNLVSKTNAFTLNYLLAFSQKYYSPMDYRTIEQTVADSNKTTSADILNLKNTIQTQDSINYYKYAEKDQDENLTLVGYVNNQWSDSYYFDKSTATMSTIKVEQALPSTPSSNPLTAGPLTGYSSYTFSPTTGYSLSGTPVSIYPSSSNGTTCYYTNGGTRLYKWVKTGNSTVNPSGYFFFNEYYVDCTTAASYVKGNYVSTLIANGTDYPINGSHTDGYWYERKERLPKYTLYKYSNLNFMSKYDVINKQLITAPISLNQSDNGIKVLIDSSGTLYRFYVSTDNVNWTEVTDKSKLDGNNIISLPTNSNIVYIKIDEITSIINKIEVRERNY